MEKVNYPPDVFDSSDEVEWLANELRMRLYRTSVKDDLNVGAVFRDLAESYVDKVNSYR